MADKQTTSDLGWVATCARDILDEALHILDDVVRAFDLQSDQITLSPYSHTAPPRIPIGAEDSFKAERQSVVNMLVGRGVLSSAQFVNEQVVIVADEARVRQAQAVIQRQVRMPGWASAAEIALPKSMRDALPSAPGALPHSMLDALPSRGDPPARPRGIGTGLVVATGLERYTLVGQLGQGGTSAVWSAKADDGETVAIKFLNPDTSRATVRRRFRNEMRFCEVTQHPNIVRSLDRGLLTLEDKEYAFYVMPRFPATLRAVLKSNAPIPRRLALFGQALTGLEYAHSQGVVHRDLKPENILIDGDSAVLADFGIAKLDEETLATTVITATGDRLANFMYAAPEQRPVGGKATQASDVYAMGLILNELFTDDVPQGAGYVLIGDVAPEFAHLDAVVERMIQNRIDRRLRNAADVRARLKQAETEATGVERIGVLQRQAEEARTRPVESAVQPLGVARQDYIDGTLVFWFDRMPDSAWRHALSNLHVPQHVRGYGPNNWRVPGNQATLSVDHAIAGEVGRAFLDWLPSVEAEARAQREREAQEQNAQAEIAAREEALREQQRIAVLRQLEPAVGAEPSNDTEIGAHQPSKGDSAARLLKRFLETAADQLEPLLARVIGESFMSPARPSEYPPAEYVREHLRTFDVLRARVDDLEQETLEREIGLWAQAANQSITELIAYKTLSPGEYVRRYAQGDNTRLPGRYEAIQAGLSGDIANARLLAGKLEVLLAG